jgi:hypothetical protein
MYVLPRDAEDRHLDTDMTLSNSLASGQDWLSEQTAGKKLRVDTFQGLVDMTFQRLSLTDAEIQSRGPIITVLEQELKARGFNAPDKVYALYYEGGTTICAQGDWPPENPGTYSGAYLHAAASAGCGYDLEASRGGQPELLDYVTVHEVLHTLGMVPECASHSTHNGHVGDSSQDLMSNAPSWVRPVLDVGHDDYFRANIPGCPDLDNNPYVVRPVQVTLNASVDKGSGTGVISSDIGGISCPESCSASFDRGTTVVLTPQAGLRSIFAGWGGACTGTEGSCTLTLIENQSVTAMFTRETTFCIVPNVKHKPLATAKRRIVAAHCRTGRVRKAYSKTVRKGRVISQRPRTGKKLVRGSKVNLIVSRGKATS